jgi:hypothetical protein
MPTPVHTFVPHANFSADAEPVQKDRDLAMLDCIGDVAGSHALILSDDGLELMCALLRRGCAAATTLRGNDCVETRTADLMVIPHASSTQAVEQALKQAKRAMLPDGRIVLRVENDLSGWVAFTTARLLRAQQFSAIRIRSFGDYTLVTAERHSARHAWFI